MNENTNYKSISDRGTYHIDQPVDPQSREFFSPETIQIDGWAFVETGQSVPPEIYIELISRRTQSVRRVDARRCNRVDVAKHFRDPGLTSSGFTARVELDRSMHGEYAARICQTGATQVFRSGEVFQFRIGLQSYEKSARDGLARRFLRGSGLEIGALQKKLTLPAGCKALYVDRMPLKELFHHYPEMRGMNIQAPDLIDDGETLAKVAGETQDFVIANHFLEHCQDPIRTIENLLRVLRTDGILFMAIPDKHYTFDSARPATSYSVLKQARQSGVRAHIDELYREWIRDVERVPEESVPEKAQQRMAEQYSIHFNVWTLESLMNFLLQAKADFILPFSILATVSADNEVILVMQKTSACAVTDTPA
jgi:predicted SAM-dependent methyltransferase